MKNILARFTLVIALQGCIFLSSRSQDIFTRGLVYQDPGMKKVIVKENNDVNDTWEWDGKEWKENAGN